MESDSFAAAQTWLMLRTDAGRAVATSVYGPGPTMGGNYRGTGGRVPPKKKIVWGRKRKRPPIIAPFSNFFKNFFSILFTVLVYCVPTFKFPDAYINLYVPVSPSDLVVPVT